MHSAHLTRSRSRRRRMSTATKEVDDESSSRPSTQESKRSSYSRLSTDSGAGSLDDFNNRRYSSPDFWSEGVERRHTAPIRKLIALEDEEEEVRPNTVWGGCSPRCSLSRYAPLPAIGVQQDRLRTVDFERPVPVRRQCFMGPLDIDNQDDPPLSDTNDNETSFQPRVHDGTGPPLFSLTLDSDTDSDFDEESETNMLQQCVVSDEEDVEDSKPRRTLIRSATFTIEKERPDVRGPFLTVAVRLPDATRVEDSFDCKETLENVCELVLDKAVGRRPQRYVLITNEVPRRTFKDMTMSLKEAGIDDKTLLYLESLDDCDSE